MSDQSRLFSRASLATHIVPVSGMMIGVLCITLVGLTRLAEARSEPSYVDEFAALNAVSFLASSLAFYLSIRLARYSPLSYSRYRIVDVAWKVVGVGSLSTSCWVLEGLDSGARFALACQKQIQRDYDSLAKTVHQGRIMAACDAAASGG
jgi:hypothetical protein